MTEGWIHKAHTMNQQKRGNYEELQTVEISLL